MNRLTSLRQPFMPNSQPGNGKAKPTEFGNSVYNRQHQLHVAIQDKAARDACATGISEPKTKGRH